MNKTELISSIQQIKDLAEKCLESLGESSASSQQTPKKPNDPVLTPKPLSIDFDIPMRPFIKKYAKGMSGAKKFTLLLSRLVNGDLKRELALSEIEKYWNKMKSKNLLSMDFNRYFSAEAKNNDWVDSKKKGFYNLRPSWKGIFKSFNG